MSALSTSWAFARKVAPVALPIIYAAFGVAGKTGYDMATETKPAATVAQSCPAGPSTVTLDKETSRLLAKIASRVNEPCVVKAVPSGG